jgi:hypothetical protein
MKAFDRFELALRRWADDDGSSCDQGIVFATYAQFLRNPKADEFAHLGKYFAVIDAKEETP